MEEIVCPVSLDKYDLDYTMQKHVFCDFFKFIIYGLGQFPEFNKLSRKCSIQPNYEEDSNLSMDMYVDQTKTSDCNKKCSRSEKERNVAFESINTLTSQVLSLGPKYVPRFLILFGGTIMHPKVAYSLDFTSCSQQPGLEKENFPSADVVRHFFQRFVPSDTFRNLQSIAPTSIHILLLAGKDFESSDCFLPKLNFKIPSKCPVHCINVTDLCCIEESNPRSLNLEDLVWYLSPVTIKGCADC